MGFQPKVPVLPDLEKWPKWAKIEKIGFFPETTLVQLSFKKKGKFVALLVIALEFLRFYVLAEDK